MANGGQCWKKYSTVIDTHQHLIYRDRFEYPWTEGIAQLCDISFTLSDYQQLAADTGISRTLFMETDVGDEFWQEETRYILSLAQDPSSSIAGIIASCRPEENEEIMEAWLEELQDSQVVGFRRILHEQPDAISTSEKFVKNLRKVGYSNKTFDLCILERQLPLGIKLAQRCDNTQFILNHCGIPDIKSGDFEFWKKNIIQLASLSNVNCKLSGVIAYCPPNQTVVETITPYIEHCIQAFGWERVIWGSDWPICNLASSLSSWTSVFCQLLSRESDDVRARVFQENAVKIYNL